MHVLMAESELEHTCCNCCNWNAISKVIISNVPRNIGPGRMKQGPCHSRGWNMIHYVYIFSGR